MSVAPIAAAGAELLPYLASTAGSLVSSLTSSAAGSAALSAGSALAVGAGKAVGSAAVKRGAEWLRTPTSKRLRRASEGEEPAHADENLESEAASSDVDMSSVSGESRAESSEGNLGTGVARAAPLPAVGLPAFNGTMSFKQRQRIIFPSDHQRTLHNGDAFNWYGYVAPGHWAIPFMNTALYMTYKEASWMKAVFTHWLYQSAAVKFTNFQCHSVSATGQNAPGFNMPSSGVFWKSMQCDSTELGILWSIGSGSASATPGAGPHATVPLITGSNRPPLLSMANSNGAGGQDSTSLIQNWTFWWWPGKSCNDNSTANSLVFIEPDWDRMLDMQMGSPLHDSVVFIQKTPRDWRSNRTAVPKGAMSDRVATADANN